MTDTRAIEAQLIAGLIHHPELIREPVVATVLFLRDRYFSTPQAKAAALALFLDGPTVASVEQAFRVAGGLDRWRKFFTAFKPPAACDVVQWAAELSKSALSVDFEI